MLELLKPEYKYYIIGLFQGDASHSESTRNRGKIQWEVSIKDKKLVYKVKDILKDIVNVYISKRTRNVSFKTGYNYDHTSIILSIFNLDFRKEIKPYIPVGSKCNIIEPPKDIPTEMIEHYLRGLYDADGSLGITGQTLPYISICTKSGNIKDFICKHMFNTLGITKKLNRNKRDNVYNIMLTKEYAQEYSTILYSNASLYLDRKYDKYLEIQSWVRPLNMKRKV